jgi:hypothetical protein
MFKLRIHTSLKKIRKKWIFLYEKNKYFSPYQSFEINLIIKNCKVFNLKRLFLKSFFIELLDSAGNTCMIAPLYLKKKKKYIEIYFFGDFCSTGYLDFIYADNISSDVFKIFFELITEKYGKVKFILNKLNERSILNNYLLSNEKDYKISVQKNVCVHIPLKETFDVYWDGLSKNTKQNIRTSRNRLEKDCLNFIINTSVDKQMPDKLLRELYNIYWKRALYRMVGSAKSHVPKFLRNYLYPIIVAHKKLNNVFYSVLRIEGNVAGFCSGFISKDKRIVVPYLAIDDHFSRYSPGGLLLVNTIKDLLEMKEFISLDLSRGDESYKYTYGGVEHINYHYEFFK